MEGFVKLNDDLKDYILNLALDEKTTMEMKLKQAILNNEKNEFIQWMFEEFKNATEKEQQLKEYFNLYERKDE